MYTLEGTVVIQSSGKFVRMLILIISRSSSKLGHVRSKTRSLDQILEKLCVHSGVHSFVSNVMTFVRMLIIIISRSSLKLGHVGSKTRLLGQQATQVSDLGPLWPSCLIQTMSLGPGNRILFRWSWSHDQSSIRDLHLQIFFKDDPALTLSQSMAQSK